MLRRVAEGRDSGCRECEIFSRCGLHFAYKSACLQSYDCNLHFKRDQYLRRSVSLIYVGVWKCYLFLFQKKKLKNNPDLSYFFGLRASCSELSKACVDVMLCYFQRYARNLGRYCIAEDIYS